VAAPVAPKRPPCADGADVSGILTPAKDDEQERTRKRARTRSQRKSPRMDYAATPAGVRYRQGLEETVRGVERGKAIPAVNDGRERW